MIYFDNSATTYPKPRSILKSTSLYAESFGFNSGRGGYKQSIDTAQKIFSVREKCANFFEIENETNICFTQNCTYALNMAIKGNIKKGDHIIISSLEHNAVARTIKKLYDDGVIEFDIAEFSYDTDVLLNNYKKLIKRNTKMIVTIHASNVFGVVLPINEIGKLAKDNGIIFVADCAQSAGIIPVSAKKQNIDYICSPGHKGLYSLMGVGFLGTNNTAMLDTLVEGGTGSLSKQLNMPNTLPDRLEVGTLNNCGIISLGDGIDFIKENKMDNLYNREMELAMLLFDELNKIDGVNLYTPRIEKEKFVPIISFNVKDYDSEKTASLLAENDVATRGGFHCSPLAHKSFNTYDRGTVRASLGAFNSINECENFLNIVKNL